METQGQSREIDIFVSRVVFPDTWDIEAEVILLVPGWTDILGSHKLQSRKHK